VVADLLTVNPTVDAGYYAYVTDLCSGEHTVKFSGELPPNRKVDVTYRLTIEG
jgi:hypothetical protein